MIELKELWTGRRALTLREYLMDLGKEKKDVDELLGQSAKGNTEQRDDANTDLLIEMDEPDETNQNGSDAGLDAVLDAEKNEWRFYLRDKNT